ARPMRWPKRPRPGRSPAGSAREQGRTHGRLLQVSYTDLPDFFGRSATVRGMSTTLIPHPSPRPTPPTPQPPRPDVEVVVPVYNEERVLADSIARLHSFLCRQ